MLKMLMFKKTMHSNYLLEIKIESFWQDDLTQAKGLIFTVVSQAEQVPKVQKRILKQMLLEPSFVME